MSLGCHVVGHTLAWILAIDRMDRGGFVEYLLRKARSD